MRDAGVEAARKLTDDFIEWGHKNMTLGYTHLWQARLIELIAAHTAAALVTDRMERHEEFVEILERRIVQVADLTARLAAAEEERDRAVNREWNPDIGDLRAYIVKLETERDTLTAAVAQARQALKRIADMGHEPGASLRIINEMWLVADNALAALTPPPGGSQPT